jgi:di/tricarboxylate transporter
MPWKADAMDLASISLAALLVTIVLSCTSPVNPGFLAIVFAWVIGVYVGPHWGHGLKTAEVLAGFPTDLFLTLVGVTLLFTLAQGNGTLERVARGAVRGCRGNTGLIPPMFFVLALTVASIGAGNIAAAALIAPMAMAVAGRANIPPFLMTVTVAHGCVAGALSPIAPTGIIANGLMARMGMSGYAWQSYAYNLAANALVAAAGYLAFGGWRLFRDRFHDGGGQAVAGAGGFAPRHAITLAAVGLLIVGVTAFHVHVGMGAFAVSAVLVLAGLGDEKQAVRAMPWGVIVMVCGVTVLTSLLEKTGGIDLFTTLLARFATHRSVTGLIALVTGLVSVYSSTSGVVLPAFLPSVPGLVQKLGGGNPLAIASSILIGGHLVDVSPLSTIGALCVASAPASADRRVLFNQVLVWGLSMAVAGAAGCYLAFGHW